jgi:hypothetical protein
MSLNENYIKNKILFLIILTSFLLSCSVSEKKSKQNSKVLDKKKTSKFNAPLKNTNQILNLDINKSYPSKKIAIQDIANVEYVVLEKKDNKFFAGRIISVTEDKIIGSNYSDGTIFIFSRDGKIINTFNHQGKGPNEYTMNRGVVYDGSTEELFVNDMVPKKVVVYDIKGNYKRTLPYHKGRWYSDILNLDKNCLLCCDTKLENSITFFLISKLDGSKVKDIQIPFKKKLAMELNLKGGYYATIPYDKFILCKDYIILNEISSDTIFRMRFDTQLSPFVVRHPTASEKNPPELFWLWADNEKYTFFHSIDLKKIESSIQKKQNISEGRFKNPENAEKEFVYNKTSGNIYNCKLANIDYEFQEELNIKSTNNNDVKVERLDAYQLIEAYQKKQLKGELKKIASTLNENDNPVLMIMKLKNTL